MTRRLALSPAQAAEIRAAYIPGKRGYGYGALAKKYGVGASTVRDVIQHAYRGYL